MNSLTMHLSNRLRIALCACFVLLWALPAVGEDEVNKICPVLTGEEASDDYVSIYKGKEVRFCCNECKQEFEKNPEIYVKQIPQLQDLSAREELGAFFDSHTRFIVCGALLALLIGLRAVRHFRPAKSEAEPSAFGSLFTRKVPLTVPLLVLLAILGYEVYSLRSDVAARDLEDRMHFATFYDFGYPPIPKRPEDVANRLTGTYYRGNDERSPKLFNEGNYRTATFHVSLVDADGEKIAHEDDVEGVDLFVRLEIERPPFTPDFLYSEELMSTMFLTHTCDRFLGKDAPVEDRVNLTAIEPAQRWEAVFPIGRVGETCCGGNKRGVVYVCEEFNHQPYWFSKSTRRGGSRFHYGIRYDLNVVDGKLTPNSDVYMGALYRTRKFPKWRLPMDQWFSHEPIPELPGENVDDPDLLGISDRM